MKRWDMEKIVSEDLHLLNMEELTIIFELVVKSENTKWSFKNE